MKTINLSYDVSTTHNGVEECGETCMNISMLDELADKVIADTQTNKTLRQVETIIRNNESLKGRRYIAGSIKDAREVGRY